MHDLMQIKLYPLLALQADRQHLGGAFRAWSIVRALSEGNDSIPQAKLDALLDELRVDRRNWRNWYHSAKQLGLLIPHPDRIQFVGLLKAAQTFECKDIGKAPTLIDAERLVEPGWKAFVWAGYEAYHEGKPISRKTQHELAGVKPSTQRRHDKRAGVKSISNYAKSEIPADHETIEKEHGQHKGIFVSGNKLAWRLPSQRYTGIEVCPSGSSRRVNLSLGDSSQSAIIPSSFSSRRITACRLFFDDPKKADKAMRKETHPREVYCHDKGRWWKIG